MSKKEHVKTHNTVEDVVMEKIRSGKVSMKPRWYFVMGSLLMSIGIIGISIGAIFLTNISLFLLRQHGPMGEWKLQLMLQSFPWWIPILAGIGVVIGILLLKRYDFSYKKNFRVTILSFITLVILAAILIDILGLNDTWFRQGPMRGFYQSIEMNESQTPLRKDKLQNSKRFNLTQ